MPEMKKYIEVCIEIEEIRAALKRVIRSDHSNLIADVIMDNLQETEVGLAQLYQAMSGVRKKLAFKPLDAVYAKPDSLHSWRFDKDKMKEAGLLVKGRVKCIIQGVNPQKRSQYYLEYEYIGSDGEKQKETQWVAEDHLIASNDEEII